MDTIQALEYLGFHDIAKQMLDINSLFKDGQPPTDIEERNAQWDSWSYDHEELLDRIDENFWKRNEALEQALMEHIISTKIGEL
jgi:hypothetical protein